MANLVANRVAGVCYVYTDGQPIPVGGKVTVGTWGSEKETLKGLSGVVGYKEMPIAAFIEVEVLVTSDVDLQAFQNVRDSVVVAELANGQTFTLRGAWTTKAAEHDAGEGTSTLRFESGKKIERS